VKIPTFGNSGTSSFGGGPWTMTIRREWAGFVQDESRQVYNAFARPAGNFIDTANFYTNGRGYRSSESLCRPPSERGAHEVH